MKLIKDLNGLYQLEELQEKYGTVNETDGLPSSDITKPALVIAPHKNAKGCANKNG